MSAVTVVDFDPGIRVRGPCHAHVLPGGLDGAGRADLRRFRLGDGVGGGGDEAMSRSCADRSRCGHCCRLRPWDAARRKHRGGHPAAAPTAPGADTFVDFCGGTFISDAANAPTCALASFAPSVLIVNVAVFPANAADPSAMEPDAFAPMKAAACVPARGSGMRCPETVSPPISDLSQPG